MGQRTCSDDAAHTHGGLTRPTARALLPALSPEALSAAPSPRRKCDHAARPIDTGRVAPAVGFRPTLIARRVRRVTPARFIEHTRERRLSEAGIGRSRCSRRSNTWYVADPASSCLPRYVESNPHAEMRGLLSSSWRTLEHRPAPVCAPHIPRVAGLTLHAARRVLSRS